MEFLGIGPLELVFILIIIIVVVGPRDIQKTARALGRGLNALYKSEGWKAFNEISKQFRNLPHRLARQAELEELQRVKQEVSDVATAVPSLGAWTAAGKNDAGKTKDNAKPQEAGGEGQSTPEPPAAPPASHP